MKKYEIHARMKSNINEHLVTLHMLTVELNLKRVLELGTETGQSTIALLEAVKEIGGRMWSIDFHPCLKAKETIEHYGLSQYWTFIQDNTLKVDWKEPIDHLFIDTLHTKDHLTKELNKFEPFVTDGGIITMHDTDGREHFPGMMEAIKAFLKRREDLRFYNYLNCGGLGIIFKGNRKDGK